MNLCSFDYMDGIHGRLDIPDVNGLTFCLAETWHWFLLSQISIPPKNLTPSETYSEDHMCPFFTKIEKRIGPVKKNFPLNYNGRKSSLLLKKNSIFFWNCKNALLTLMALEFFRCRQKTEDWSQSHYTSFDSRGYRVQWHEKKKSMRIVSTLRM